MDATVDEVGRIVLPKALRDRLRLTPGTKVDVSEYGDGLHVTPVSRTARIEERDGRLVAVADTVITDDDVVALIEIGRDDRLRPETPLCPGSSGRKPIDSTS